jgi:uncharacterized protein (TIGR02996 family)
MFPEETRFLEHVCANPANDGPRLIYADWLDERDDPRGEFIRVQIALARMSTDDLRRPELLDREAALLARHHARWSDPLRGLAGSTEFRRGFVDSVIVEAETFLRRADDLFRLAPVEHVQFLDLGSHLDRLVASPFLAQLSGITISAQHIGERLARALAESPYLDGLRSLNLTRNRVGDRGAGRLVLSRRWLCLTELDLSDNRIGDNGARALAESTNVGHLESLELRHNEVTMAGLAHLCSSRTLTRLRHLGLRLNFAGFWMTSPHPRAGTVQLASIDLSENSLAPAGVEELTRLPGLSKLARLELEKNEIGSEGVARLANWSGAACLRELLLSGNRIGDDGARRLARSPFLHQLTDLDLGDNPIHDPGAIAFLSSPSLPCLRRLGMPNLGLTPQTRAALKLRFPG